MNLAAGVLVRIVDFGSPWGTPGPLDSRRVNSVLYLLSVYALVAIAVLAPLFLLYVAVAASWFVLVAIGSMIRSLKNASAMRTGFLKEHWSMIHR